MVFNHVGLSWIIDNNIHLKFDMEVQGRKCMEKVPWYNTTTCSQLNGHSFEDFFKTLCKDRYELMYYVYAYGKEHAPIPDYASSGNVITMPINPFKGEIISLGQTINFIDNWLQ